MEMNRFDTDENEYIWHGWVNLTQMEMNKFDKDENE